VTLRRADALLVGAVLVLAFGLRVIALGQPADGPAGHVFDERYFADAACRDLSGQDYLDPEPPLGKLLIAAGIEVGSLWLRYPQQPSPFAGPPCRPQPAGYGTWGWRLASLAFGVGLVALIYLLAMSLWPSRVFATLAAVLVTFDGLEFVQSRLAMLDIFPVFFAVLALLMLQVHRRAQTSAGWWISAATLGLAIGLGVASKWTALAAWGVAVVVLAGGWVLDRVSINAGSWHSGTAGAESRIRPGPLRSIDRVSVYTGFLIILPAIVYVLSYARYVMVAHAIPVTAPGSCDFSQVAVVSSALDPGHWLQTVFRHDRWAYAYHLCETRIDPRGSPWFSWPLMLHPATYRSAVVYNAGGEQLSVLWDLGNPALWWAAIPALIYCALSGIRSARLTPAFIALAYLAAWLPFAFVPRGLYLYHMLGALPYMALAVAYAFTRLSDGRLDLVNRHWRLTIPGGRVTVAYLLVVVATFIFFYPLWTGTPVSREEYRQRIWLDLPQVRVDWRSG